MRSFDNCRQLRADINTFLVELGNGSIEVANRLRREGVTGTPKSANSCAIARYVSAVLTSDLEILAVRVGWDHLVVTVIGHRHNRKVTVPLPQPVKQFVRLFDRGDYPELIAGEDPVGKALTAEVSP